jgi:glycosyltransferase involved in cell wall biosynthesis
MRVGILIPKLHGGGAEFVARQWSIGLRQQGHDVVVYLYARQAVNENLPDDITVRHYSARVGHQATLPLWFRHHIHADQLDVVLSLLTYSNVVALLALKTLRSSAVPLVISERNMPTLHARAARRRDRTVLWLSHRLYRRAAGVIAISHPVAAELVSAFRIPPERLFVVPNPILRSPTRLKQSPHRQDPSRIHIVCVGRQAKQKRPHLFIAVLRELTQKGLHVRATVIGDGPLRHLTERESLTSGLDVAFTGWQEPWWLATSDIDCLLLTAQFEGLANVLVEAAAAGIPAVASSRALGVADAVLPGITGDLVLTDSPAAFADAVLRAVARPQPPQRMIEAWLERFSLDASTRALVSTLQTAISSREVSL